jgi:hypothetical protein
LRFLGTIRGDRPSRSVEIRAAAFTEQRDPEQFPMRYLLTKTLRTRFTRELRRSLPQFRERKARSGVRGTTLYEWRATPTLTCYVALVVDDRSDRFTVELAWSRSGHFPAQVRNESAAEVPRGGAMRLHLRSLWQRFRVEPSWSLTAKSPAELTLEHTLLDPEVDDEAKAALIDARERSVAAAAADPDVAPPDADEESVTEALERLGPAVDDVMQRLRRYAVPYFDRIAAQWGGDDEAPDAHSAAARSRIAGPV